jgi:hypothetical protein
MGHVGELLNHSINGALDMALPQQGDMTGSTNQSYVIGHVKDWWDGFMLRIDMRGLGKDV